MPGRTHYDVLGVTRDSSTEDIRRAYLQRARELHPDRHADGAGTTTAGAMQDVNEAWRVLRDPARRAAYDRSLLPAAPAAVGLDDEPTAVHPASFRSAVWLVLILLLFVTMLVVTAYAGGGGGGGSDRPSARELLGSCVRIEASQGVDRTPCEGPHDGQVLFVADRASRCPRGTRPHDVAGDVHVLCLDR